MTAILLTSYPTYENTYLFISILVLEVSFPSHDSYFMIYIDELDLNLWFLFISYLSCMSSCCQHFLWRILLIVLISKSSEVLICICTFYKIHRPWFSYLLDCRCQSMHQTLLFTKRKATNELFLTILNNTTILISDIKVVENVDFNKVMKQTKNINNFCYISRLQWTFDVNHTCSLSFFHRNWNTFNIVTNNLPNIMLWASFLP